MSLTSKVHLIMENKTLYKVTPFFSTSVLHSHDFYVVATNPSDAEDKMVEWLRVNDYGTPDGRKARTIEIVANESKFLNDDRSILIVEKEKSE
jgi:hypothetical protein